MTHTYSVWGMTCSNCETTVRNQLSNVNGVKDVTIDRGKGEVTIEMSDHIPTSDLQAALKPYPKYQLTEMAHNLHIAVDEEEKKSWLQTYKPLLLVFGYITAVTFLAETMQPHFSYMNWMRLFMSGFFLVFSFFKLLDLKGFAESYATYDILAKNWTGWGYIYAFLELSLGTAYLIDFEPLLTNAVNFVVMSISIIGVLQSVLNKRKIKCACLGAGFNLPMSTVTVIEDALMIMMSGIMFVTLAT